jgi:sugar phosphate isomerase/epimerase
MCERYPDRDARGRLLPGHSGNPAGRPVRRPYLRLLEAAEACGAEVVVLLPPRRARADDVAPTPPRAA